MILKYKSIQINAMLTLSTDKKMTLTTLSYITLNRGTPIKSPLRGFVGSRDFGSIAGANQSAAIYAD